MLAAVAKMPEPDRPVDGRGWSSARVKGAAHDVVVVGPSGLAIRDCAVFDRARDHLR